MVSKCLLNISVHTHRQKLLSTFREPCLCCEQYRCRNSWLTVILSMGVIALNKIFTTLIFREHCGKGVKKIVRLRRQAKEQSNAVFRHDTTIVLTSSLQRWLLPLNLHKTGLIPDQSLIDSSWVLYPLLLNFRLLIDSR